MPRRDRPAYHLNPGDEAVIVRQDGTCSIALHDETPNLSERGQALLGAAFKVTWDPAFRAQQLQAFRLYHTPVEGVA